MNFKRLGWLIVLLSFSMMGFGFEKSDAFSIRKQIPSINFESSTWSLNFLAPKLTHDSILSYQQHFFNDLKSKNLEHLFYQYPVGKYQIVSQLFLLDKTFETVIISHGYLDHSGFNQPLINLLLNNQFNVIVFDQPGHGLSSGIQGEIDTFDTYANVINQTISFYKPHLKNTFHIIGHSTGNVGLIDTLHKEQKSWSGKTIMLAPLIRSKVWFISKYSYNIGSGMFFSIPRKFRNNSHNKAFKAWLQEEPFAVKYIPKNWIDAHHIWEEKIQDHSISNQEFTIIQGQSDLIVDFKYNQKYLKEYFPNSKLIKIKKANHHLINESQDIQQEVFKQILLILRHKKSD